MILNSFDAFGVFDTFGIFDIFCTFDTLLPIEGTFLKPKTLTGLEGPAFLTFFPSSSVNAFTFPFTYYVKT